MRHTDVCIIGAGPGGITAAMHLAAAKVDSIILEKHSFPRDKICGDALSGKVLNELRRIDANAVRELSTSGIALGSRGVTFYAPNGNALRVPFAKNDADGIPPGFISKRLDLDNFLFQKVRKRPEVRVVENDPLVSAERIDNGILLHTSSGMELLAKVVIDASGANSWFSRNVAKIPVDRKHHCAGLRAYYRGVKGLDPDGFIELHFIKEALPGYFWIFPLPNGEANVGLGMRSDLVSKKRINVKELFAEVIAKAAGIRERFEEAVLIDDVKGFPLPLGSKRRKISGDNYMLIGDAAHLIDPFTGEGISNAMISGRHAADVCVEALQAEDYSKDLLREYDKRVYRRLGQELSLSYRLQQLAQRPGLFNLVVNKANRNEEIRTMISSMFDDIDLREKLRKPSFYWKVLVN